MEGVNSGDGTNVKSGVEAGPRATPEVGVGGGAKVVVGSGAGDREVVGAEIGATVAEDPDGRGVPAGPPESIEEAASVASSSSATSGDGSRETQ
jgi:hypothetical protein